MEPTTAFLRRSLYPAQRHVDHQYDQLSREQRRFPSCGWFPGHRSRSGDRRRVPVAFHPDVRLQYGGRQRAPADVSIGGRRLLRFDQSRRDRESGRLQIRVYVQPDRRRRGAERSRVHADMHLCLPEPNVTGIGIDAGERVLDVRAVRPDRQPEIPDPSCGNQLRGAWRPSVRRGNVVDQLSTGRGHVP